jgi:hypothetical protein
VRRCGRDWRFRFSLFTRLAVLVVARRVPVRVLEIASVGARDRRPLARSRLRPGVRGAVLFGVLVLEVMDDRVEAGKPTRGEGRRGEAHRTREGGSSEPGHACHRRRGGQRPQGHIQGYVPSGEPDGWCAVKAGRAAIGPRSVTERQQHAPDQRRDQQARVVPSFHGPETWTRDKDRDMFIVGDVHSSRLHEVLREDFGGVYGVGANGQLARQEGVFTIQFGCDPERVDVLIAATRREICGAPACAPGPVALGRVLRCAPRRAATLLAPRASAARARP